MKQCPFFSINLGRPSPKGNPRGHQPGKHNAMSVSTKSCFTKDIFEGDTIGEGHICWRVGTPKQALHKTGIKDGTSWIEIVAFWLRSRWVHVSGEAMALLALAREQQGDWLRKTTTDPFVSCWFDHLKKGPEIRTVVTVLVSGSFLSQNKLTRLF